MAAADTYYALRGQLDTLVNQRQAQLQALSSADGAVGALLARDFLVTLRPALSSAAAVIASTYQQAARDPLASAMLPAHADRSIAPGMLLGAHLDPPQAGAGTPGAAPDHVVRAAWRSAVLASTSLTLARAAAVAAAIPDSAFPAQSLTLSAASFDDAGVVSGETDVSSALPAPPSYQSLGDAEDLWPARAVQSFGADLPLRALDPRIWRASPPAPTVAPPPVLTAREGLAALRAYTRVAATLSSTLGGIAPPSALVSAVDPAQRLTSVAGLSARTGQYTLSAATSPSFTQAALRTSFVAPQVTWAFSATTRLNTATATLSSSGSSAGFALQSLHLHTAPGGRVAASTVQGSQMSISVTRHGNGKFLLTTGLPDGTLVQATAELDNIASDPDVQAALARERLALLQLQSIIPAGNAVYARLQPFYAAREHAYQLSLGSVMARNQQIESYWWARSTAHSNYLLARSRWLKLRAAYQRYLAHRQQVARAAQSQAGRGAQGASPASSPTAPSRRGVLWGVSQQPSVHRHAGMRMPLEGDTATPAVPLFGSTQAPTDPSETATAAGTPTRAAATPTDSPTEVPVDTATPSPEPPTATPVVPPSASTPPTVAIDTPTPTVPAPTSTTTAETPTAMPSSTSSAPTATELPSRTDTPPATTDTPTVAMDTPTETPIAGTPTATAGVRVTSTAGPTSTATAPSETPSATPTSIAEASATATASATPKPAHRAVVDGPTPTPVTYVTTPPGPPPAYVPDPGLEPDLEPLPPPVLPLPGWLVAPPIFIAPTLHTGMPQSLNASGYANLTPDQLYADGAMDVAGGFSPPIQGVITTYWGGSTPWQSFHPGLDIAAPAGVPVRAAADGVVVYAGLAVPGNPTMSYGNCVLIQHAANISTLYGHMQVGPLGLQVQPGEVVHQGQIIGYEGATGWATGPHVHFEMRLNNTQFDPLLLVSARTILG